MDEATGAQPSPILYTTKQACIALNCSLPKLYELMRGGDIQAYRVGWRTMISPKSCEAYMTRDPLPPQRVGEIGRPEVSDAGKKKRGRPRKAA